jgi:hypothetical protein
MKNILHSHANTLMSSLPAGAIHTSFMPMHNGNGCNNGEDEQKERDEDVHVGDYQTSNGDHNSSNRMVMRMGMHANNNGNNAGQRGNDNGNEYGRRNSNSNNNQSNGKGKGKNNGSAMSTSGVSMQARVSALLHMKVYYDLQYCFRARGRVDGHRSYARLLCTSAFQAGAWLQALPCEEYPSLRLSDSQYQLAARFRLGLPPVDTLPNRCSHPKCNASVKADNWHCLSCLKERKNTLTDRHDAVNKAIRAFASYAGIVTREEPYAFREREREKENENKSNGNDMRLDLKLYMDTEETWVDTTIVHPGAVSHLRYARRKQLACADIAVSKKQSKYRNIVFNADGPYAARFLPVAFESYGGWSNNAKELISSIRMYAIDHSYSKGEQEDVNEQSRIAVQSIAIAIQRGNARAAMQGMHAYARGGGMC